MSLAEKLAVLTTPDPGFRDPEKDQDDLTSAKVADYEGDLDIADTDYLEAGQSGQSKLRIQNASLDGEDKRYAGKKTSRKARNKLMKDDGDSSSEDGEDIREHAAAELGHMFQALQGEDEDSGEDDDNESEHSDEENETEEASGFVFDTTDQDFAKYGDMGEEGESDDDADDESDADGELETNDQATDDGQDSDEDQDTGESEEEEFQDDSNTSQGFGPDKASVMQEVEKGKMVTHQLKTWDKLLETRIQEQKMLTKINQLPVTKYWDKLVASDAELSEIVKEAQISLKVLLNDLCYLDTLLAKGPENEPPAKKKKLSDFSSALQHEHEAFKQERNNVIQRWNEKTRISTAKNSFASLETSTVGQIDQILSNPARLIQRTRLKRTNYSCIGRTSNLAEDSLSQTDSDIFDDDDFYHQLLRDLIDRKTSGSAQGSQLTRQWLEVQKLRTRLKKKVDTKASKGRKIRYDIHAKMVNFMAPVYDDTQRDQTKNELFSSLFGTRRT